MKKFYLIVDEEFTPYIAGSDELGRCYLVDEYGTAYLYRKTSLETMLKYRGIEVIAEWEEESYL